MIVVTMHALPSTTPQRHAVLHVEYDGTPYFGWSRQPHGRRTIEGDLRAAFEAIGCTEIMLCCAGRTDAGVHATAQVVDAQYTGMIEPYLLAKALTGRLPSELVVTASSVAPAGFDARRWATSRAYEYRVLAREAPSPTRARFVLHHPRPFDRELLRAAARAAQGKHRFTAFTPSISEHTFFDRTLLVSEWIERGDELVYQVRANAFLRHMVRILVGSMLGIARGEGDLRDFARMLDGAPRSSALQTAPARGLCLVDVSWDQARVGAAEMAPGSTLAPDSTLAPAPHGTVPFSSPG